MIFVTGGSGFIGSNLIEILLEKTNEEILNVDNLSYAAHSFTKAVNNSRYSHENVDITDKIEVARLFSEYKPSVIFHLAAESHVDNSINSPEAFVKTNILGTYNLLEASRIYKNSTNTPQFRFIHVSTDEVYGSLDIDVRPFTEKSTYDPSSPYSASKASSDHIAMAYYRTYKLPVIITNCSNNYGKYQHKEKLLPTIILSALRGESIPIYGKGDNIRDWIHVSDHCHALIKLMNSGKIGEKYNIGSNHEMKNIDLAMLICSILDSKKPHSSNTSYKNLINFVKDRPGHDHRYAINSNKISKDIGWEPKKQFEQSIGETVDWYIEKFEKNLL